MPCWTTTNLLFCCSFSLWQATCSMYDKATGMSFSCRCGLFGIWWGQTYCAPNSMEFESRFMPLWLTGTRACCGTIARPLGLGTESCFYFFVVSSTNPHWSPISCVLPSPGRLAPSRAEVFVGFRCVRLVQALSSSPPSAGLVPCPSTLRFSFSLALLGFARSGPGVSCWCSLLLLLRSPLRVLVK